MSPHLTECRFWLSSSDDDWHSLSSSSGLKLDCIGCIYYNIVAHEEPFVYLECIFTEVRTLTLPGWFFWARHSVSWMTLDHQKFGLWRASLDVHLHADMLLSIFLGLKFQCAYFERQRWENCILLMQFQFLLSQIKSIASLCHKCWLGTFKSA